MKRHWKSIALAALSALGSMIVAALTRQHEKEDPATEARSKAPEAGASQKTPGAAAILADRGTRAAAVNFLSDVLAETYRKVRSQEGKTRR